MSIVISMIESLIFRKAETYDLPEVMALLAEDVVSKTNPASDLLSVFQEINLDPNNEIIVGILENKVIACLQATYIPCLTLNGMKRVLIEGVRVHKDYRSKGIGHQLFKFTFLRAKQRHCQIVQLTTNNQRQDAIHFYETLGFKPTHVGMKLNL
jgi:GNAT superfamily N-acetyltransferase